MFAVDLGGRTTKAICLSKQNDSYALTRFAVLDAPIFERSWSAEQLAEHLKAVVQTMEPRTKQVTIAIGLTDMVVRPVEMPPMPAHEMRQILKINSKAYLQQDLPGYVFDCFVIPPRSASQGTKKSEGSAQKNKVLIAGAKKTHMDDLQAAIRAAGLIPDFVVPTLIGPANAFERAYPEIFANEVIALIDIGFKSSTICLLQEGELVLTRTVNIGGDRLTSGLAEMMNITYAEAEGIKVGMPTEVQPQLEMLVSPLGRELRASIDFFEHQQDRTVSQAYISGGSARSDLIVQALKTELGIECVPWNPTSFLHVSVPERQTEEIEQVAPQLTVAIGAGLTAL